MARRVPQEPAAVLGVRHGASRDEITRAYRSRARQLHPDVSGGDTTAEMARITAARDALLEHAPGDRPIHRSPERRERPGWATAHGASWTDHWAAWNEPRRDPRDDD